MEIRLGNDSSFPSLRAGKLESRTGVDDLGGFFDDGVLRLGGFCRLGHRGGRSFRRDRGFGADDRFRRDRRFDGRNGCRRGSGKGRFDKGMNRRFRREYRSGNGLRHLYGRCQVGHRNVAGRSRRNGSRHLENVLYRIAEGEYREHDVGKEHEERGSSGSATVSLGDSVEDGDGQDESRNEERDVSHRDPEHPPSGFASAFYESVHLDVRDESEPCVRFAELGGDFIQTKSEEEDDCQSDDLKHGSENRESGHEPRARSGAQVDWAGPGSACERHS